MGVHHAYKTRGGYKNENKTDDTYLTLIRGYARKQVNNLLGGYAESA